MKLPGFLLAFVFLSKAGFAQTDSVNVPAKGQSIIISSLVRGIDELLPGYPSGTIDTIEYFEEDGTGLPDTAYRQTSFYFTADTQMCRITETVRYHNWTTEVTVYYYQKKTLRYERTEKYLGEIKDHFIIGYFQDKFAYMEKLKGIGIPQQETFLNFSYQLLNKLNTL